MTYTVTGFANLHRTMVKRPAFNICNPAPAPAPYIFDINCSLVCTLGEPFIRGGVSFSMLRVHPDECEGSRVGIRWISGLHMVSLGCPSTYDEESPNNNTWVGSNVVTHGQGADWDNPFPTPQSPRMPYDWGPDFSVVIKTDAVMTAIAPGSVALTLTTSKLMPESNTYFVCGSTSMLCLETPLSIANGGKGGRTYKSEITPSSFDGNQCGGDLKYIEATISLDAYDFGCSVNHTEFGPKCNLKSGSKTYSCLVCLVTPATPLAWNPYVIQLGVNYEGCLTIPGGCGCINWDGTNLLPKPDNNDEAVTIDFFINAGCPNETPYKDKPQRIQYGVSREWPSGDELHIMLKTIDNGSICVAAKTIVDSGITPPPGVPMTRIESPWILGSLITVQSVSPFIMKADFSGLIPGNPVFQFYGLEFPTSLIQECIEAIPPPAGPPPLEPHGLASLALAPVLEPTPAQESSIAFGERPEVIAAKQMARKMQNVRAYPCVNLGMALEAAPSCGCGGGILHQCSVHGDCRQAGNDPNKKLCWKCDDYIAK